jgi:hypothetical protein
VSRSLFHLNDNSSKTSQVDLPSMSDYVYFVYLSGDKLYTSANDTLYVYLVSEITSPIATYLLRGECHSAIISDDCLYIGGDYYL